MKMVEGKKNKTKQNAKNTTTHTKFRRVRFRLPTGKGCPERQDEEAASPTLHFFYKNNWQLRQNLNPRLF